MRDLCGVFGFIVGHRDPRLRPKPASEMNTVKLSSGIDGGLQSVAGGRQLFGPCALSVRQRSSLLQSGAADKMRVECSAAQTDAVTGFCVRTPNRDRVVIHPMNDQCAPLDFGLKAPQDL